MPSRRKSWLPFANRSNKAKINGTDSTALAPQDQTRETVEAQALDGQGNEERLRPIQFAPNRLATLYVTPSERNLYLAAMSQLDENPPHLPLWSDPAPSLPQIQRSQPIHPPPLPARPHQPYPSDITYNQQQPKSLPMTHHGNNAKLMASPEAQTNGGLMIRDEFRRLPPAKEVKHASMTLTASGGLRFYQFPANALLDLEPWFPANKVLSEPMASLRQKSTSVVPVYSVDMFGSMWKRAGSEELEYVILLCIVADCLRVVLI